MLESIQENPFIPIAWQKHHSGMQGTEYLNIEEAKMANLDWLKAKQSAVHEAKRMYIRGVTKQLCNRLLEPFMWTTMLITGSEQGWKNFFELRCPQYQLKEGEPTFKSWEKLVNHYGNQTGDFWSELSLSKYTTLEKLQLNKGQAEIHMMDLAEKVYDAMNESTPKQLKVWQWHIPFEDKIRSMGDIPDSIIEDYYNRGIEPHIAVEEIMVKISSAMAARTSYTVVGDEKEISIQKMIELHDRLLSQDPPHSSPLEHCAKVMNISERDFIFDSKNIGRGIKKEHGWCRNYRGFIQYRYIVEDQKRKEWEGKEKN